MRPILFHIPLSLLNSSWSDLPIYGYGLMLFLAFLGCNWLAQRLCRRQGIDPRFIPDLAIWLFVAGILGGRLNYVIWFWDRFEGHRWDVVKLWDGGLVLYGALFGGAAGYFAYDHFILKKTGGVSKWRMLDVVAPCIVLGVALGRVGCLCTGCCFGNVACPDCPAIHFPYGAPSPTLMIGRGLQTPFGFVLKERSLEVRAVEPGTPAEQAGIQAGDVIVKAKLKVLMPKENENDKEERFEEKVVPVRGDFVRAAVMPLELTVRRGGSEVNIPAFTPTSLGLHPTQIYETISMCLLLFLLLSYFPYRRREGELMVILLFGYGIHRYLNETLRTDTDPIAFGLTMAQLVSIGVLALGVVLAVFVYRRPPREEVKPWVEPPPEPTLSTAPTEVIQEGIKEMKS